MTTNVLLVSAGFFHPPWLGRFWLLQTLQALPDVRVRRTASLESLPAFHLHNLHAVVLYIHQQKISVKALEALIQFISLGGGLLAVHSATASFKNEPRYFEILGGRFTGHGPLRKLHIEPANASDEVFSGIGSFDLYEEPYEHEMDLDCKIHFFASDDQPSAVDSKLPVVWTRLYGQGRVCYCLPGHTAAAIRNPAVREILQRSLTWVCRRNAGGEPNK